MRCEDYPCCGHDICPDFDDNGNQLDMKCTCGASVPIDSGSSLCATCLQPPRYGGNWSEDGFDEDWR